MVLAFHWAFFLMTFGYGFAKMGINIQPPKHMDCSCNLYVKIHAIFFRGLFLNSHANASFLFFTGLLFQSLLSLGKSFSFCLQIYNPPRVAKKLLFMRVVVLLLSLQSEFAEKLCLSLARLFLLIACMLLFDLCLLGLFGPTVCFPSAKFH